MRAMILAAGRGERLRPVTDRVPKPLVEVAGKALIVRHLEALSAAGFREIVINHCHLGDLLVQALGDGSAWSVNIHWSMEAPEPLETGGGIFRALPKLGNGPFLAVNGDIWTDYPFSRLRSVKCDHAHLVMVPNPAHNPNGDFSMKHARVGEESSPRHTFSGMAVYHPRLFAGCEPGRFSVVPLIRQAMRQHIVTGERYDGAWSDIGTLERLEDIRRQAEG